MTTGAKLYNFVLSVFMHKSFVTTHPPPHTHTQGQRLFNNNSPAKNPVLRGPTESHMDVFSSSTQATLIELILNIAQISMG